MFDKDLDQLFRQRLADHVSDVPGDMWLRIRVKDHRRRAILIWRWYIGGFLLLAILFAGTTLIFRRAATTPVASAATTPKHATPNSPAGATPNAPTPAATTSAAPEAISGVPTPTATAPATPASAIPNSSIPTMHARVAPTPAATVAVPATRANTLTTKTRANPIADKPALSTSNITSQLVKPVLTPPVIQAYPLSTPIRRSTDKKPSRRSDGLFMGLYGSPDHLFTRERRGLSYTGGVRLTKRWPSGVSATLGLQGSRYNLITPFDSSGDNFGRYFWTLDVPALVGYTWGRGKLTVGAGAGIILNLHTWSGGTQPATVAPIHYEGNSGISYYLGVIITQRLGDGRYSLFAEPYYRHPFSPSFDLTTPLRSFSVGGLTLGIRRQF